MDEAEKKALITELLTQLTETVLPIIDQKNQGLASALERKFEKKFAPVKQQEDPEATGDQPSGQRLTMSSLQTQIQELQTQLKQKTEAEQQAKRDAAIASTIASVPNLLQPKLVQRLIRDDYGGRLKEENGTWFFEESEGNVKPLSDVVTAFLASDEGKIFTAPSGVKGTGSTESQKPTGTGNKPLSIDEQYAQLFQG